MKRFFLLIILLIPLYIHSQERILLIVNSGESYSRYIDLMTTHNKELNFHLDIIEEDNLESYLDSSMSHIIDFALYLDSSSSEYKKISGFKRGLLPPLEITKWLLDRYHLESRTATEFPLYISGIIPQPEKLLSLHRVKIPTLYIEGVINTEDVVELLSLEMNDMNRHYFIYSIFGKILYVNDLTSILMNLGFITIVLLLINLYSKRMKFHLKHNFKYFGTLPIKILSIYVFYYISTLVLEYIIEYSGSRNIIYNYPKTFFIIKHLILFFIYGISFQVVKDSAFSKSPHFYSIIGLLGGIIFYFFLLVIYQPLALYQFWFIICTILYIFIRNINVKRTFLFLSPLVILLVFYSFFNKDHREFVDLFITNRYNGNLLSTFIILPYLFLQESFFRFTHRRQKFITHTRDIVLSLLTLTTIFTMLAIILELSKN